MYFQSHYQIFTKVSHSETCQAHKMSLIQSKKGKLNGLLGAFPHLPHFDMIISRRMGPHHDHNYFLVMWSNQWNGLCPIRLTNDKIGGRSNDVDERKE